VRGAIRRSLPFPSTLKIKGAMGIPFRTMTSINDLSLVAHILRDQLRVAEADFYRCVNDRVLPPRPALDVVEVPAEGLHAKLIRNLILKAGLTQKDVAMLDRGEAIQVWQRYLADHG
jgi:hypothetical protein